MMDLRRTFAIGLTSALLAAPIPLDASGKKNTPQLYVGTEQGESLYHVRLGRIISPTCGEDGSTYSFTWTSKDGRMFGCATGDSRSYAWPLPEGQSPAPISAQVAQLMLAQEQGVPVDINISRIVKEGDNRCPRLNTYRIDWPAEMRSDRE